MSVVATDMAMAIVTQATTLHIGAEDTQVITHLIIPDIDHLITVHTAKEILIIHQEEIMVLALQPQVEDLQILQLGVQPAEIHRQEELLTI